MGSVYEMLFEINDYSGSESNAGQSDMPDYDLCGFFSITIFKLKMSERTLVSVITWLL